MKRLLLATPVLLAAVCLAQDSLGDLARHERMTKSTNSPQHEITNDDIATSPATTVSKSSQSPDTKSPDTDAKKDAPNAADVQAKIRAQKEKVKALEDKIAADQKQLAKHENLGDVTVYQHVLLLGSGLGSGSGIAICNAPDYIQEQQGYKDWCDEPDKLQDDMDATQKQLDSERAILESMQEEARQQGFGNSIYDPD